MKNSRRIIDLAFETVVDPKTRRTDNDKSTTGVWSADNNLTTNRC